MRSGPRPVAMIVHSYYDEDPRVRREAEALVARGRPVDVYGLRRPGDPKDGWLEGVRVRRLDVQRHQGAGFLVYLLEYVSFFVRATLALVAAQPRRRYALVQVHSLPDFLVFAALPLRLVGVPVILDLHEAMTELFAMRFPTLARGPIRRLLELQERISAAAADHVLTVNAAMEARLLRLGVPRERLTVVPNSPDLARFDPGPHPRRAFREDGQLRIIYTGALTPTYEVEVGIDAVAAIVRDRPDLDPHLDLYGRGDLDMALRARALRLWIEDRVTFHGRVPFEAVPPAVAGSDVGIAPTRRDVYTDSTLSTKIFEYGAMGKPVVASWLPLVEATFGTDSVNTYPSGDAPAMAAQIIALADDAAEREARVARLMERVAELNWAREAERYVELVGRLVARRRGEDAAEDAGS
jgi:glycosyltransferase involved in cell wall biosynthesis